MDPQGRAVVIAVLGPIRAGKGLTTGLQGLAGFLHGDRIRKIVSDNPALLMQDFARAQSIIGHLRGPQNLATLWPKLSPAARLNLCLDPWGDCRGLNLSSVGLEQWHSHWGNQGFQIISQDSYLESQGQLPFAQLSRDLRNYKNRVNADLGMPRIIILEGFEWIMPQYNPKELLPLIDYMVVLHASEGLIKSRARHPSLWEREVLPMVEEFQRLFPSQSPPHEDVSREGLDQDGVWQSVPSVDCLGLFGLNLEIAHFMGPGTKGEEILSRARQIAQLILSHVATQVSGDWGKATWQVYLDMNCFDGHGGANVNLEDDNERPKLMSVEDAKRICEENGYAGFTYEPSQNRVWWLSSAHDPIKFNPSWGKRFEVHVRVFSEFSGL
eukprot:TRINITY_DN4605_c0_g1_i1.p1 TRINITY_DN4605_c0_g1~~TRINITY_DN4605_c0_g1_i1.p1  ORF type:complete len:383 (+),score=21.46 TRINITY_DN4605_c0_g1_i1:210-1358(+)